MAVKGKAYVDESPKVGEMERKYELYELSYRAKDILESNYNDDVSTGDLIVSSSFGLVTGSFGAMAAKDGLDNQDNRTTLRLTSVLSLPPIAFATAGVFGKVRHAKMAFNGTAFVVGTAASAHALASGDGWKGGEPVIGGILAAWGLVSLIGDIDEYATINKAIDLGIIDEVTLTPIALKNGAGLSATGEF